MKDVFAVDKHTKQCMAQREKRQHEGFKNPIFMVWNSFQ